MNRDYRAQRVTIMGLGHFGGGVEAAAWLVGEGARVTVTDLADHCILADSLARLVDEPIEAFHLGEHREEDFRDADLVVVNPAVPPGNRFVQIARESGARVTSEIELFIEHCPAQIIGVTGSNGKSTTAAMIDAVLRDDRQPCWLGGNLGGSLLSKLMWIQPGDWVVLEISSSQLWRLAPGTPMPRIVVITGCSPNHLDWHPDSADYVATKQRILLEQTPEDLAVLNVHNAEVAAWEPLVRGRCLPPVPLEEIPPLKVPGEHNRINAACAAAAAVGVGCPWTSIRESLAQFNGLPQRLEQLAVIDGRTFYNDSAATTPESTIAALVALDEPIWLLAGGRDKGLDFGDLVAAIAERTRGAAFFGSVRDLLRGWVLARNPAMPCTSTETLADAFDWCWQLSAPGEAIVLSPACASKDQFQNYHQRGVAFVALVRALEDQP